MATLLPETERRHQPHQNTKRTQPKRNFHPAGWPQQNGSQQNGHDGHLQDGWTKAAVAELSNDAITGLPRRDLIAVIRAGLPCPPNPQLQVSLDGRDTETLQRLAFLSRRACRHQGY